MTPKKLIVLGVLKLVLIVVAFGIVYSLYGCGTVHGVGEDVSKLGSKMEKSSSGTVRGVGEDVNKIGQSIQKKADE